MAFPGGTRVTSTSSHQVKTSGLFYLGRVKKSPHSQAIFFLQAGSGAFHLENLGFTAHQIKGDTFFIEPRGK